MNFHNAIASTDTGHVVSVNCNRMIGELTRRGLGLKALLGKKTCSGASGEFWR